ncbi:hypothetical protein PANA5342_0241 [Pantoea ananatis LMG 5342]|nr:hypothetical protein PANA5342_0241 [Pantoea ananatis LMG 5342]
MVASQKKASYYGAHKVMAFHLSQPPAGVTCG